MKEKTKMPFKKKLIISIIATIAVTAVMAFIRFWRGGWTIASVPTFMSDVFALAGACYLLAFVICIMARTTFFARVGYNAQKRSARKNKTMPKYKDFRQYMEQRPDPSIDIKIFWIPSAILFAISIIFVFFAL